MNVEQAMSKNPRTCRSAEPLSSAARQLWEHDCGSLPVIDAAERLVGMITDRDICMSAYTNGLPLQALTVAGAMAKVVHKCGPKDTLDSAAESMQKHQVRRLPVVDAGSRVIGMITLSDLVRAAARNAKGKHYSAQTFAATFTAVTAPRSAAAKSGTSEPSAPLPRKNRAKPTIKVKAYRSASSKRR